MRVVGVIPARFASTRFPGKPLADICGRPMVWWVHRQLSQVEGVDEVYVALDDERVAQACGEYGIRHVMTSKGHPTHLDRLAEFCQAVDADFYVNVNGDEPLMRPGYVAALVPQGIDPGSFYAANAMTVIRRPVEVSDIARIKVVTDAQGFGMYLARSPIPYPKASAKFDYYKFVGIQCFSKPALEFCAETPRGRVEAIEDIDEYRFLENGRKVRFVAIEAETLSVDTAHDLERVRSVIGERIAKGEITL
ncbi:MAG: 3-deoxy-manno-octulosonate cytidylyltransferase [Eggerthellaceae bacterium]|nr:3-deoxy-manno-octulosonate cytidylyltransferase [Eggerthellaceae bacterium]